MTEQTQHPFDEVVALNLAQEDLHERHVAAITHMKERIKTVVMESRDDLIVKARAELEQHIDGVYKIKRLLESIYSSGVKIPDNVAWIAGAQSEVTAGLSRLESALARIGGKA